MVIKYKNKFNIKISIVIPIFNEAKNLKKLTHLIKKNIKNIKHEIIFIDDNSKDDTLEILKNLKLVNKNIKFFIRKALNKDLSKSCILGFEKSKYNNILVMDGDLQHNPKYIKKMIKYYYLNKFDFVIGSRDFENFKKINYFRCFISISLIKLTNIIFRLDIADPLSGFFLFKKKFYAKNKKNLYSSGFKILIDLITSQKKATKIGHVQYKFMYRQKGKSKADVKQFLIYIFFLIKGLIK